MHWDWEGKAGFSFAFLVVREKLDEDGSWSSFYFYNFKIGMEKERDASSFLNLRKFHARAHALKVPTSDKNSPGTAVAFLGIPVKCSVKGFVNLYSDVALRKIIYFVLRGMIFLDE